MNEAEFKYLKVLAKQYPNIAAAATEIVNLQAILNLPKGTEHFISDIHGEYEQFRYVMSNGSGAIRRKIEDEFGNTVPHAEKLTLAMLIYYPECKLKQIQDRMETASQLEAWYQLTIHRMIRVCKNASSKYTRSKVRKALPPKFSYIIEELLSGRPDITDQEAYYDEIINSVIHTKLAPDLIIEFGHLIRRFTVDHLHVIGDIFDRGPYPHLIMDTLMKHHSIDIQWGNHDVLWMGAAGGSEACMCNILRISAKYGNLCILEDAYGINMLPLARLAMQYYQDDPCESFLVSTKDEGYDFSNEELDSKMHKAIAVIQFKIEGHLIKEHPEWEMQERLLLDKMDLEAGTVTVEGRKYKLNDTKFPTLDKDDPYALTQEELDVLQRLKASFIGSERLQRHIRFLYSKGGLYKVFNGNLLFHGCVPLEEDGTFRKVNIYGKEYAGKRLYDILDHYSRKGYYSSSPKEKKKGLDILWFTWEHKNSPLFGKDKMTTFERYFIDDKSTHKEPKNPYYKYYETEETVDMILEEFGLSANGSHIINGHIPVAAKNGESPTKCNGKLLVIDGGFSKAYQGTTGIAGYTLTYNSFGLVLAAHEPFTSMEQTVLEERDIQSHIVMEQSAVKRKTVGDTDTGKVLRENIADLEKLLDSYRSGVIAETE